MDLALLDTFPGFAKRHPFQSLGVDVVVHHVSEITRPEHVSIGDHCSIDFGFYCTTRLRVGSWVHIGPHVTIIGGLAGDVEIGDFVTLAAKTSINAISDSLKGDGLVGPIIPEEFQDRRREGKVTFQRFSFVGCNSVIMPGVKMAEGSVLGAQSFLATNTEPWTIYAGCPAKPIKKRRHDILPAFAQRMGYGG